MALSELKSFIIAAAAARVVPRAAAPLARKWASSVWRLEVDLVSRPARAAVHSKLARAAVQPIAALPAPDWASRRNVLPARRRGSERSAAGSRSSQMSPIGFPREPQENTVFDTSDLAQCAHRRPVVRIGTAGSAPAGTKVFASTSRAWKTMSPSIPRAHLPSWQR